MRLPFPLPSTSRPGQIVAAACVIALLFVGRDFFVPLALASVLSLVIGPLKKALTRRGFGHVGGALVSVLLVAVFTACLAAVLVSQLVAVARDVPQYKATVRAKLERLHELTIRPLERFGAEWNGVVPQAAGNRPARSARVDADAAAAAAAAAAPAKATDAAAHILASVWAPLGEAGIVLVLLVFILLEQEGLRDRMIRLAGEAQAGRTMQAVEDAAQGVSSFLLSQLIVNLIFGVVLGSALWLVGVPHAVLWGAVSALARFVPYLGPLAAAALISAFAAAVDPGWTLMIWSLAVFVLLELPVANILEPTVYGHSSGIAPLGVIVAALFWGILWGPVGLLLSTPITLCLVVAGRHVPVLAPITILFGEAPGLQAGLRLYQRALSGAPGEIVAAARVYLRRSNFARYCDQIVLPGLALADADGRAGRIGSEQQNRVRLTIAAAVSVLGADKRHAGTSRRRRSTSLIDANVGAHLHAVRQQRLGGSAGGQGSADTALVLCIAMESPHDQVLADLLAQSLRDEGVDARTLALALAAVRDLPQAERDRTSAVFLTYPVADSRDAWRDAARELRGLLANALVLTIELPLGEVGADDKVLAGQADLVVGSFSEALAFVLGGRSAPA